MKPEYDTFNVPCAGCKEVFAASGMWGFMLQLSMSGGLFRHLFVTCPKCKLTQRAVVQQATGEEMTIVPDSEIDNDSIAPDQGP